MVRAVWFADTRVNRAKISKRSVTVRGFFSCDTAPVLQTVCLFYPETVFTAFNTVCFTEIVYIYFVYSICFISSVCVWQTVLSFYSFTRRQCLFDIETLFLFSIQSAC